MMRISAWIWRVISVVVVAAFVVTLYEMTHNTDSLDAVLPAANWITVAGTALLGVVWTVCRRYWYALAMVVVLGLVVGLFRTSLVTEFQSWWLIGSAGLTTLVLLATLIARTLKHDRAQKAAAAVLVPHQAPAQPTYAPAQAAAPAQAVASVQAAAPAVAPPPLPEQASVATEPAASPAEVKSEAAAGKAAKD